MTSLSFTNTLSASTEAATHTDQVTSSERDEVSDKERQREQRKRNTPIDWTGSLVWFWGGLWSGPAWPTLTAETLGSTGAHPYWQREREGWREKERRAAITKATTVRFSWWLSGWKPMSYQIRLGQMLHRHVRKPLLHLCGGSTIREAHLSISPHLKKQTCFFLIVRASLWWQVRDQGQLQVSF